MNLKSRFKAAWAAYKASGWAPLADAALIAALVVWALA